MRGSPKGKTQRGQYTLTVDLSRYMPALSFFGTFQSTTDLIFSWSIWITPLLIQWPRNSTLVWAPFHIQFLFLRHSEHYKRLCKLNLIQSNLFERTNNNNNTINRIWLNGFYSKFDNFGSIMNVFGNNPLIEKDGYCIEGRD